MSALRSSFNFGLGHRVLPGCAGVGCLDSSTNEQLVVGTTNSQVNGVERQSLSICFRLLCMVPKQF